MPLGMKPERKDTSQKKEDMMPQSRLKPNLAEEAPVYTGLEPLTSLGDNALDGSFLMVVPFPTARSKVYRCYPTIL